MEKWQEAYRDYKKGMKYKEIAEKYGVTINAVKSWAVRKWKNYDPEKVAEKSKKVAVQTYKKLQPKRGAPKGNQNALGNKGGAPEGNKNNLKHGIYEKLLYSALSEEEQELFKLDEVNIAEELKKIINLCDIQIMKFMRKIKETEEISEKLLLDSANVSKRNISGKDTKTESKDIITTTNTIAPHNLILKYSAEIERIKKQKIKCLEDLRAIEKNTNNFSNNTEIIIKIGEENF